MNDCTKENCTPNCSTKTRILDAAVQLFARDGFHGTSLRTITSKAMVNLAAVNYHFGSKDALLKAVFERHLLPLNQIRQEKIESALRQAKENGKQISAEAILRAFIEPTLAFRRSETGAQDFIALVGRSLSEPDETVRNCFIQLVLPNFQLLFGSLQQALPELPPTLLFTRLQFTMGAMSHVMCMSNHAPPPLPGIPEPLDDETLTEELIQFARHGLEAPC